MSPEPRVWRDKVQEVGTKYHRARLTTRNRTVITQADLTGVVLRKVYDLHSTDADTAIFVGSNTIASTVFNSLQPWEDDADGYNLEVPTTSNEVGGWTGGHTYRIEVYYTHSSEGLKNVTFEITPAPLLGVP